MNSRQERSEFLERAPAMRALAFVLLIFMAYGSVAEVTHKHGGSATVSVTSAIEASNATAAFNVAGEAGPLSHTSSPGECLICQLHHDLFASQFTHHLSIAAPTSHLAYYFKAEPFHHSLAETPERGRAPPSASFS